MTDLANQPPQDNTELHRRAFTELCWARARLWKIGTFGKTEDARSLHEAIDFLHTWTGNHKLIDRLGQDAVQTIMMTAFRPERDDLAKHLTPEQIDTKIADAETLLETAQQSSRGAIAAQVRKDLECSQNVDDKPETPPDHAPQTTVEAIMYAVRTRGLKALNEPDTLERLRRCSEKQLDEIDQRIAKLEVKP